MAIHGAIVSRFGDVNPISFGGGVLILMPGDKYGTGYEMEVCRGFEGEGISEKQQENGAKIPVYRFCVEKDIKKDLNWVDWHVINENWPDNWKPMDEFFDGDMDEIARIYWIVGDWYGWRELDQYPNSYSDSELRERWSVEG